ncbi:MAG: DUF917 domain-containing protein [Pseudomonadota bacterium]
MLRRTFLTGSGLALGALTACQTQLASTAASPVSARGEIMDAQTLEDALVGGSILGTGGGGSLKAARELIAADLAAGMAFRKLSVADLDDSDRVGCPYGLASLAPLSDEMRARLDGIENRVGNPTLASFRLLEKHMEQPFSAVILGEIGPLSMAEGLSIAAHLGIAALDADTVGRAVPEINQHSVRVAGVPLTPASGVTPFGDELILQGLQDPSRQEDVFRTISVISREVGVTDSPMTGATAKRDGVLVQNSLTLAIRLGRAARTARDAGQDPIEAIRAEGDGFILFDGVITEDSWADTDGFLVGDVVLSGRGDFEGQTLVLDYKNEHLVAKRNGKTIATCPDLISMIDKTTFEGVNNPDFKPGQAVSILGFKCDPIWRTEAGLEVFSPRYFGYDEDYIPIEERLA